MSLLMYDELTSELVKKIENGKNRINIISAFCKIEALEYLDKYTSSIPEIPNKAPCKPSNTLTD